MSKKLFLIEAPGKLKKLQQILGSEYIVKASGGHIRELAKDGDDNLGFDLKEDSISCRFVHKNPMARKTISQLKELARQVDTVILATDEDREGEIIAWHLKEVLNLRNPQRITYLMEDKLDARSRSEIPSGSLRVKKTGNGILLDGMRIILPLHS